MNITFCYNLQNIAWSGIFSKWESALQPIFKEPQNNKSYASYDGEKHHTTVFGSNTEYGLFLQSM